LYSKRGVDAQPHLEGVAVQRAQAFHRGVVVEGLLLVHQPLAQLAQAQDLGVFQDVEVAAFPARVVVALEAVDIVFGRQLALAPLKAGSSAK
jgi:hypothetical protein